jgi:hypothetical protein
MRLLSKKSETEVVGSPPDYTVENSYTTPVPEEAKP